ncbi:MAG: GNAT family N-acetyltransferase [Actinomycetota bacterium]
MRIVPTDALTERELAALKGMLEEAYGEPFVEDWDHALGGTHFLIEEGGEPVSHASVVERALETGGRILRTGYVEAVATRPDRQRRGLGTRVMDAASEFIRREFELGALGTGEFGFYAPFGWERWRGPTAVRTDSGVVPTPEEDGYIMILRTAETTDLDQTAQITCEWRLGDVW